MATKKTEHGRRSTWWWCQKGIAALVCAGIAIWLAMYVRAAVFPASITGLEVVDIETPPSMQPIGVSRDTAKPGEETDLRVPTATLKAGASVTLRAAFSESFDNLPYQVARRVSWRMVQRGKSGLWSPIPAQTARPSTGRTQINCRFDRAGQYLVLVALPPIDLHDVEGKSSSYVTRFLSGGASSKCQAFQVIVLGFGTTRPLPQPVTQPATQPATRPATRPAKQPATQPERPRDFRREGKKHSSGTSDKDGHVGANTDAEMRYQRVPKREDTSTVTSEQARRARIEGIMPELLLTVSELDQLNPEEWTAIRRAHDMPFVLVPRKLEPEYYTEWQLLLKDGSRKGMAPSEIKKVYGMHRIPLAAFSARIQKQTENALQNKNVWQSRHIEDTGFYLNRLLDEVIVKTLSRERMSLKELSTRVASISARLEVERRAGRVSLRVELGKVTLKK